MSMNENRNEGYKPYKFSPEELKVIQECGRESFFQRCVPFSTILGFATYYGVKSGYLKPSPRFGASPKVAIAGLVGYFLGKLSYQSKCVERIMQLPNSPMADMLRKRRRGNIQDSVDPGIGTAMSLAPFGSITNSDVYIDSDQSRSYDLDTNIPVNNGLDDAFRPSLDNPAYEEIEMPPLQKNETTYEELRKQNREEYAQKRTGNFKEPPKPTPTLLTRPALKLPLKMNKYGDDME